MIRILIENVITVFFAVIAVFFMIQLVPGDPAQLVLGEKATPEAIEKVRVELGLDKPVVHQLGDYFKRLAQGNLGSSIRSGHPVLDEISTRLPATIELALSALFIATIFGILLGMLAARHPGGWVDLFLGAFSVLGLSLPIFFLGLLMALFFGVWLEWLPISGRISYSVSYEPITGFVLVDSLLQGDIDLFLSGLQHLILPAATLATVPMSLIARLMRSSLIETLKADYIRTARAKGQSEKKIFFVHAFRNALLPVITMTGFQFGVLLGGAILTENVFAWPGMGRWLVFSVEGRDFPAVQGSTLVFATGIIVVMALTEWIQTRVDPRLKAKS